MANEAEMEVGSDLWNARIYDGLSVASELAAGLGRPAASVSSLFSVWKMNRRLGHLNRDLEEIFAGYDNFGDIPKIVPGPRNIKGRDILLKLYSNCVRLLSPQDGLPLFRPLAKNVARLSMNSERLLDLADWLDAMSTPEENEAKFAAALAELAAGETVVLAR